MKTAEVEDVPSGRQYRILLAGEFGLGRAGDEATLASMVEGLRGLTMPVAITAVSGDPAGTAAVHGITAVALRDLQAIAGAVKGSDLTILGGAWFDDRGFDPDSTLTPQHRGLSFWGSVAVLPALYGRPFMLYGAGIGPLVSEHARRLTKAIADTAACISVRDQSSREQLRDLGIADARIRVTADLALGLRARTEARRETPLIAVMLGQGSGGVAQEFWERQVAAALDLVMDAEDGSAVFVPLASEDDRATMRRVIGEMRHASRAEIFAGSFGEIIPTLEQCRVVLAMPRDSILFSALAGVPFVTLECEPEVARLAEGLGMGEFRMQVGSMEGGRLAELLRLALARREENSQCLRLATAALRSRERENVQLAAALLESPPRVPEASPEVMGFVARVVESQMRLTTALSAERGALATQHAEQAKDVSRHTAEIAALRAREDALRWRTAQDSERIAYAELRVRRLCRELDQAKEELRSATRVPVTVPGSAGYTRTLEARLAALESKSAGTVFKRGLLVVLDLLQIATPELLKRLVRRYYLEYFYFRMYPERRPALPAPAGPSEGPPTLGYAPFIEFKYRLYRNLPADFQPVSCRCQAGLISVVLPVYNGARYLRESIESVRAQTYGDWELIVVDDGSTDETLKILAQYDADPRVRIIRQAHQKLPAALSRGFAAARGEFYAWTSDDNLMEPEQLTELATFLYKRPDVEMVYADESIIDKEGRPAENTGFCPGYQMPPGSDVISRPQDPGELNFVSNNYIGGCFLYRAWAGKIVGDYDSGCFGFEDYDYWMRMNALFRISHLGVRRTLYRYRLHSSSLTARDAQLRITDRMRAFTAVEESRRSLFEESFDITLVGRHPWFQELGKLYREYGNNVFSMDGLTETTRYHHEVTRAFPKSAMVFSAAIPQGELQELIEWSQAGRAGVRILLTDGVSSLLADAVLDKFDWIVAIDERASQQLGERYDRKTLLAWTVASLAYPLLAAINSHCYAATRLDGGA